MAKRVRSYLDKMVLTVDGQTKEEMGAEAFSEAIAAGWLNAFVSAYRKGLVEDVDLSGLEYYGESL